MLSFEEQWSLVENIGVPRMLDKPTAQLLYQILTKYEPKVCVEFGTNQAKSACFIGNIIREYDGHLYCFDPYMSVTAQDKADLDGNTADDQYNIALRNLHNSGLDSHVTLYREKSEQAKSLIEDKVDFLYIDGDHSELGFNTDCEIANSICSTGSIVLIDNWPDVGPYFQKYPHWEKLASNYIQMAFQFKDNALV